MDQFVTTCPFKTPPMKVIVTNKHGEETGIYDVPSGFQLERYIMSLYPDAELHMSKNQGSIGKALEVEVYDDSGLFETHLGFYINEEKQI